VISIPRFDLIALDADDTLWHNERLYEHSQAALAEMLAGYGVLPQALEERLYQTETRNIRSFGYGIKSFALSMIETAVELTEGRLAGRHVLAILDLAKTQLNAPVELLEHVQGTVASLADRYPLMIITKGELHDQETKLQRSGLEGYIRDIVVVSDKTAGTYSRLFKEHGLLPERLVMVGNALRSDILPVLELGGHAVYVPYPGTWQHEAAAVPDPATPRFYQLEHLGLLPALLGQLESRNQTGHA